METDFDPYDSGFYSFHGRGYETGPFKGHVLHFGGAVAVWVLILSLGLGTSWPHIFMQGTIMYRYIYLRDFLEQGVRFSS